MSKDSGVYALEGHDADLVRAYRGLADGVPVHINSLHIAGLHRVEALVRSQAEYEEAERQWEIDMGNDL